jgi:hypothetical protein
LTFFASNAGKSSTMNLACSHESKSASCVMNKTTVRLPSFGNNASLPVISVFVLTLTSSLLHSSMNVRKFFATSRIFRLFAVIFVPVDDDASEMADRTSTDVDVVFRADFFFNERAFLAIALAFKALALREDVADIVVLNVYVMRR